MCSSSYSSSFEHKFTTEVKHILKESTKTKQVICEVKQRVISVENICQIETFVGMIERPAGLLCSI